MILGQIQHAVDAAAHELIQGQLSNAGPVGIMVIGALAVGTQMAADVHVGVEVRHITTGVEAPQVAAAALGVRINALAQIDNVQIALHVLLRGQLVRRNGFRFASNPIVSQRLFRHRENPPYNKVHLSSKVPGFRAP